MTTIHTEDLITNERFATQREAEARALELLRDNGRVRAVKMWRAGPSAVRAENEKPWRVQQALLRVDHKIRGCHERIDGTQNLCTRPEGHAGPCRCNAGDVDDKEAHRGEYALA